MSLRVVFMGTPEFAVPSFDAIRAAGHRILRVYTQPPRPAGRGRRPRPGAVHRAAAASGIDARTPSTLKGERLPPRLDAIVVVAYGLLLPPAILSAPRRGCLNVHASLLPRWRGAAPIPAPSWPATPKPASASCSWIRASIPAPCCCGAPWRQPERTPARCTTALAALGAEAVVEALAENPPAVPQPALGATWARKLGPADEPVDWTRPAVEIERQVRAPVAPSRRAFHGRRRGLETPRRRGCAGERGAGSRA